MQKRVKQLLFLSVASGVLIELFWLVWSLIFGEIPAINHICITETWTYVLPSAISLEWTILIGPILSAIFIFLVTNKKLEEKQTLSFVLGISCTTILAIVLTLKWSLAIGFAMNFVLLVLFFLLLFIVVSEPDEKSFISIGGNFHLTFGLFLGPILGFIIASVIFPIVK